MSLKGLCEMIRPLCLPQKINENNADICKIVHEICPGPSKDLAKKCRQLDEEPFLDEDLQARGVMHLDFLMIGIVSANPVNQIGW